MSACCRSHRILMHLQSFEVVHVPARWHVAQQNRALSTHIMQLQAPSSCLCSCWCTLCASTDRALPRSSTLRQSWCVIRRRHNSKSPRMCEALCITSSHLCTDPCTKKTPSRTRTRCAPAMMVSGQRDVQTTLTPGLRQLDSALCTPAGGGSGPARGLAPLRRLRAAGAACARRHLGRTHRESPMPPRSSAEHCQCVWEAVRVHDITARNVLQCPSLTIMTHHHAPCLSYA